jgi:hypothetical protein
MLHAHNNSKSEFASYPAWQIPRLKPHACGFARNLGCVHIPVNEKDYVVRLSAEAFDTERRGFFLRTSFVRRVA